MAFKAVKVSFTERGQRHTVEVDAETVYEAASLALKAFAGKRYIHGPRRKTVLELEFVAPRTVRLTVASVLRWLYEAPGHTPEQQERKRRLRNLLADRDRH